MSGSDASLGLPLLARLAVDSSAVEASLNLKVDPNSGLLRIPGDDIPFVERVLNEWELATSDGRSAVANGLATLLTETRDPADPDLVRDSFGLQTTFTKSVEPLDPDLILSDHTALFSSAITQNRLTPKKRDPDLAKCSPPSL